MLRSSSLGPLLSLFLLCVGLLLEEGERYASVDGDADRIVYYMVKDGG